MSNRQSRTIRLEPELWAALDRLAAKHKRSTSNLVAKVLETYVDVNEGWES